MDDSDGAVQGDRPDAETGESGETVDALNRAVAVAMVLLDEYQLLCSAQAELLRRGGIRARAGVGEYRE